MKKFSSPLVLFVDFCEHMGVHECDSTFVLMSLQTLRTAKKQQRTANIACIALSSLLKILHSRLKRVKNFMQLCCGTSHNFKGKLYRIRADYCS